MLAAAAYKADRVISAQKLDQMVGDMMGARRKLPERFIEHSAQRHPPLGLANADIIDIERDDGVEIAGIDRKAIAMDDLPDRLRRFQAVNPRGQTTKLGAERKSTSLNSSH